MILLDSSILVAAIADDHKDHDAVTKALAVDAITLVYDHSLLEAYRVLTFPNLDRGGFARTPADAVQSLMDISNRSRLLSLTANDRMTGLALFAAQNVISARIYDAMIGYAGILHGAHRIMTLNGKNFRSLFPELAIIEPA
jgi:predicted nucleic acid-binding protein